MKNSVAGTNLASPLSTDNYLNSLPDFCMVLRDTLLQCGMEPNKDAGSLFCLLSIAAGSALQFADIHPAKISKIMKYAEKL